MSGEWTDVCTRTYVYRCTNGRSPSETPNFGGGGHSVCMINATLMLKRYSNMLLMSFAWKYNAAYLCGRGASDP